MARSLREIQVSEAKVASVSTPLFELWRRLFRRNLLFSAGCSVLIILIVSGILAPSIAPYDPIAVDAMKMFQGPSRSHVFGTDRFGRDLFCRVVYGIRVTLGISGISIGIAASAGGALGLASGYFGKWIDQLFSRVMDLFFAFPPILLALGISAVLGAGVVTTVIAISVVYTPLFFRVMRASVLAERQLSYVEAAEAIGAGPWKILIRHILPNALSPMIVQVAVCLSYAVLIESALSYLGIGVQPPTPSWGTILNEGREFLTIAPWISLFPGLFIMVSVLAFNLVSDGLRDFLDPGLRR
jgi:peptide/nickel transport system permease protein